MTTFTKLSLGVALMIGTAAGAAQFDYGVDTFGNVRCFLQQNGRSVGNSVDNSFCAQSSPSRDDRGGRGGPGANRGGRGGRDDRGGGPGRDDHGGGGGFNPPQQPASVCDLRFQMSRECGQYLIYRDGRADNACINSLPEALQQMDRLQHNGICVKNVSRCYVKYQPDRGCPGTSAVFVPDVSGSDRKVSNCVPNNQANDILNSLQRAGLCR